MKETFSFTHEELKETVKTLHEHADWLEKEFEGKEEPLNLSVIVVVCNEDTGEARATNIGKAADLATSLASVSDEDVWGRVLMAASIMHSHGHDDE